MTRKQQDRAHKQRDRRTWAIIRVPPWKQEEVPEAAMKLATERVQYLRGAALSQPLEYLLASAYLQGINDCVQAHINNPAIGNEQDAP